MKNKVALKITFVVFLLALLPASIPIAAAQTDQLVINGDGSTFAYPMYSKWIEEYEKENPAVHLTYVSNGSGAGIHDVMIGTVDFAGTDGPLNKTQLLDFSTHRSCEVLHFPTAPDLLEAGFKDFVKGVRLFDVPFLDYLQNKKAEFRDDKKFLALQASDLVAWHVRRLCFDIWKGNQRDLDPVWNELRRDLADPNDPLAVKFYDFRYEAKDWERILTRVRSNALRQLGIWLPHDGE